MKNYAMFMDLIGPSRLKEMMFTARLMTADEALTAGFVHEIVPADGNRGAGARAGRRRSPRTRRSR